MIEQTKTQANTPPQESLAMKDSSPQQDSGESAAAQAAAVEVATAAAAAAVAASVVVSSSPPQSTRQGSSAAGSSSKRHSASSNKSSVGGKRGSESLSQSSGHGSVSVGSQSCSDSSVGESGSGSDCEPTGSNHHLAGVHTHFDEYLQDTRQLGNKGFVTPSQANNNQNVVGSNLASVDSDAKKGADLSRTLGTARISDDNDQEMSGDNDIQAAEQTSSDGSSFNSERRPSSFNTAIAHNGTTIFKPFDSQTGQFMAQSPSSAASMKNSGSQHQLHSEIQESSPPSTSPSSTLICNTRSSNLDGSSKVSSLLQSTGKAKYPHDENATGTHQTNTSDSAEPNIEIHNKNKKNNKNNKNTNQIPPLQPFFNRVHRSKMRSYSVPTILHSSLRKISNGAQQELAMPSNDPLPPAQLTFKHSNNSSTSLSNSNVLSSVNANGIANSSLNSSSNPGSNLASNASGLVRKKRSIKKDQFSLRNAILMTHRLQTMDSKDIPLEERIKYIKTYPTPVPLPPINLQCLKEIDLSEIVKNPQLRHDIVFDPMLQFRPNLDGERGIKKKQIADKYWCDVENEIYVYNQRPDVFSKDRSRLIPLFNTLKDVLVTIVPQKEVSTVANVLDTELLIQELLRGSLVMSSFSEWLSQLFKHHCAPMRDPWVDKMSSKFKEAEEQNFIPTFVEALRLVFQILEAMKLDIANHQIRILRPALLSNTVDFEKQYFQSLLSSNRVDLKSSLRWFEEKYQDACNEGLVDSSAPTPIPKLYQVCIRSVISLLSCRKMVKEYPTALSFDHARLILLRADIRQIVCLMVCKLLFKQLVANNTELTRPMKEYIIRNYTTKRLKEEIVSIITDEHGNCRWTKNTLSIAVQLNKVIDQLKEDYNLLHRTSSQSNVVAGVGSVSQTPQSTNENPSAVNIAPSSSGINLSLDPKKIEFATSWLSKQTQPLSDVYGVLEARVFKSLEEMVFKFSECSKDGTVKQDFINMCGTSNTGTNTVSLSTAASSTALPIPNDETNAASASVYQSPSKTSRTLTSKKESEIKQSLAAIEMEEFENSYRHLYTIVNFHWSVFGCHYLEYMGDKVEKV